MSATMSTCQIRVIVISVAEGEWFAFSSDIPWLAAEGDSFEGVVRRIEKIAPALVRLHGIPIPFGLEWRAVHTNRHGASASPNENTYASRFPHPFLPPVVEGENESLRDFHDNHLAGV